MCVRRCRACVPYSTVLPARSVLYNIPEKDRGAPVCTRRGKLNIILCMLGLTRQDKCPLPYRPQTPPEINPTAMVDPHTGHQPARARVGVLRSPPRPPKGKACVRQASQPHGAAFLLAEECPEREHGRRDPARAALLGGRGDLPRVEAPAELDEVARLCACGVHAVCMRCTCTCGVPVRVRCMRCACGARAVSVR